MFMRKSGFNRIVATALVSIAVSSLAAAPAVADPGGVSPDSLEKMAAARETYESNCAACHGYDGIPMLPNAANFTNGNGTKKADAELLQIIAKGKGDMPPWEDILSGAEQIAVLAYIEMFPGHGVLQERCASCHDQPLHELAGGAFAGNARPDLTGSFEICPGSDIEAELSAEEFSKLARYLELLSKW